MGSRALDVEAGPERVTIPIDRVPPGPYDCQVTVIDPAGAGAVSHTSRLGPLVRGFEPRIPIQNDDLRATGMSRGGSTSGYVLERK